MNFEFNLYSTPLLFGFVQGWVYAILFFWRAWRTERLSDLLFGCLLATLTFEILEYMLGFAGIEILWRELEFFPRGFGLLIPPLAWFYLRSQVNQEYRFTWSDLIHTAPFMINTIYHLVVFAQGPSFVQVWKQEVHDPLKIDIFVSIVFLVMQIIYFYKSFQLYQAYRKWTPTHFSDTQAVSFTWFRNFLIAFLLASVFSWVMTALDISLDLDFWNDWWDELFKSALIYYLAIAAWAQTIPGKIQFKLTEQAVPGAPKPDKMEEKELLNWKVKIEKIMQDEKVWMEPELTLQDLARRLNTNVSVLSAAINSAFGKNFNDFINAYRVSAVQALLQSPDSKHLSLLGIGMECGFNSKSTFNRAFKKATGLAPSDYLAEKGADA